MTMSTLTLLYRLQEVPPEYTEQIFKRAFELRNATVHNPNENRAMIARAKLKGACGVVASSIDIDSEQLKEYMCSLATEPKE